MNLIFWPLLRVGSDLQRRRRRRERRAAFHLETKPLWWFPHCSLFTWFVSPTCPEDVRLALFDSRLLRARFKTARTPALKNTRGSWRLKKYIKRLSQQSEPNKRLRNTVTQRWKTWTDAAFTKVVKSEWNQKKPLENRVDAECWRVNAAVHSNKQN